MSSENLAKYELEVRLGADNFYISGFILLNQELVTTFNYTRVYLYTVLNTITLQRYQVQREDIRPVTYYMPTPISF